MSFSSGNPTQRGRQQPWATLVILALCAATFVPAQLGSRQRVNSAAASLDQALAFHREHPYLTLDQRLAGLGAGAVSTPGTKKAPKGGFVALEQVELDGLTRAGFDSLASTPAGRWGLVPGRPSPAALLLHGFVSWSFLPLVLNLAFLWAAGPPLEGAWGPLFFAGFYLTAAVVGGAAFALGQRNLWLPFTGPGASVAAVVGACAVVRGIGRVRLPYWLGSARWGWVEAPAWILVGLWLLRELLLPLLPEVPGPAPVAASLWAHGGGLIFGALTAAVLHWGPVRAHGPSPRPRVPSLAASRVKPGPGAGPGPEIRPSLEGVTGHWSEAGDLGRAARGAPTVGPLPGENLRRRDVQAAFSKGQKVRTAAPEAPVSLALEAKLAAELAQDDLPDETWQVAAEAARRTGPEAAPETLSAGANPEAPRQVKALEAVPRALSGGILTVKAGGGPEKAVALGRVRALASAAVDDAAVPNLLLDLLLDGSGPAAGPIRVLRLQSRQFDPRDLLPSAADEEEAVLSLAGAVAAASGATWLLGGASERLRRYPSLAAYEKALQAALGL